MGIFEAPGKVNLSLMVSPPESDGYHPIESLVQTIEWCDRLEVESAKEGRDSVIVTGAELDPEDNLVTKALAELRADHHVPPLSILLTKQLSIGAGLGGGSSDAAAALVAAAEVARLDRDVLGVVSSRVGSDVPLFLTGGTMMVGGRGERVASLERLSDFALGIAVPDFALSTAEVYRRWDEMEGPTGDVVPHGYLPPSLRDGMPMRNDLLPAAIDVEPRLGDFMADLRSRWDTAVALTGAGSACFAFFATLDEATDAANSARDIGERTRGVELRDRGVAKV